MTIGKHTQLVVAGAVFLLTFPLSALWAQGWSMPEKAAIDRFVEQQMAANRVPGLALGITQGSKVLCVTSNRAIFWAALYHPILSKSSRVESKKAHSLLFRVQGASILLLDAREKEVA